MSNANQSRRLPDGRINQRHVLYDLTSTYFESDPPKDPEDLRRFGYSRDKRSDCVQVVIALIVTPEDRVAKERSMRHWRLRKYLKALTELKARQRPPSFLPPVREVGLINTGFRGKT